MTSAGIETDNRLSGLRKVPRAQSPLFLATMLFDVNVRRLLLLPYPNPNPCLP